LGERKLRRPGKIDNERKEREGRQKGIGGLNR
jgi:hypothetical protein